MAHVISIHEYDLKPGSDLARFEQALHDADARGLLKLPGLITHYFVKGTKGARRGAYAAVWIYESREAWEHIWGSPEQPRAPHAYPENWKVWEDDVLAPFLAQHPDEIRFTTYEVLDRIRSTE
jgi:hypothetical protein